MQKIKILNIGIDNVSSLELLRSLKQGVLVTPNIIFQIITVFIKGRDSW